MIKVKKKGITLKSVAAMFLIVIFSTIWIYIAVELRNDKISISNTLTDVFENWFGSGRIDRENNSINTSYLLLAPPVLLCYYLLTMYRRIKIVDDDWKSIIIGSMIVMLLEFSYVLIFNMQNGYVVLVLIAIELLFIVGSIYVPSAIKNYNQIFSGKAIAKSTLRYMLCIAIAFLISVAYGLVLGILALFQKSSVYTIIDSFSVQYSTISGLFGALVMAPFVEEMAFRGLIFEKSKKIIPVFAAAIFSAVLFGIWHQNMPQFFGTVPMGMVLALLYHQTGRLRYAMVCHSVSNLIMGLAIAKNSSFLPVISFFQSMLNSALALPLSVDIGLLLFVAVIIFLILWKVCPIISFQEE